MSGVNERSVPGFMERVRQARLPNRDNMSMAPAKMTGILVKTIQSQMGGKGKGKVKKAKGVAKPSTVKFAGGRFH